jgi:acetylornithine/succinyldiaminopimelate/putrescine aminotransferase
VPVDDARVYFAISGADAVEIAVKSALLATGRDRILAFAPSYHGTTLGALALGARAEFRAPFAAHLHRRVSRLPFGCALDRVERRLASGGFAAVVVEPVVGREGVLLPPPGWLAELAAAARAAGALLVADEVFTGFGRTGARFAVEREGVRPDLLCCGKALGGGLPIAAAIGRREVMEAWRREGEALHTATFVAHPLACVAALATLELFDELPLLARARGLGETLGAALAALAAAHPATVREVRGLGALWGLELADAARARRLVGECRARGVLLLAGGPEGRVVQMAPPLLLSDGQLAAALAALAEALAALAPREGDA